MQGVTLEPNIGLSKAAWELRGENKLLASTFASTFLFRPMLKYITFGSAAIVLAVLVNYAKTYLTGAFPEVWLYALGALFVLVTLFLPRGIIGLVQQDR